jgi:hypothetical protein
MPAYDSSRFKATAELLKIPGILGDLKKARREYAAGKGVDWREVRRDAADEGRAENFPQ